MYKGGILFAFVSILIVVLAQNVHAANETASDEIAPSYQCLEKQITAKASLSLQEAVFGVLALGNVKNASNVINSQKHASNDCWPKNGCTLKETAQVVLAKKRLGENTNQIEKWLISKNGTANDLAWFIEIDSENQQVATCNVKYDGRSYNLQIGSDMKISGSSGNCLSISSSGYLLKIRETCLSKTFDISCNQGFVSTVLYQKNKGDGSDCLDQNNATCFVSSETHAASSLGTTQEKISAYCFKTGNNCDYEGSLWAALALDKTSNKIDAFIPYLMASAENNKGLFPDAFVSILLDDEESYSNVIENRKQSQYWDISGSPYNRFYDSALGMLALSGSSSNAAEVDKSKEYFLGIRTREGCWNNNNIRDTAFILYAGWPRGAVQGSPGPGSDALCEEAGFSCEKANSCTGAGGIVKQGFVCTGIGVCCSLKVPKLSCQSQNGKLCSAQQECDGQSFDSSDGACCLGTCKGILIQNICEEQRQGVCRTSCGADEEPTSDECGDLSGNLCCVQKNGGGFSWFWIIILIILIILVAIAILFRHKIQMWWFSHKRGIKSSPSTKPLSSSPTRFTSPIQTRPLSPNLPRFAPQTRTPARSLPPRTGTKDKELEDTLRKLKEMSK